MITGTTILAAVWKNEFVRWDPNYFAGVEYLMMNPQDVWIPRLR